MDKRWLLILIILIFGVSGLYYTANESAKIGDAISTMDNVIVTLPQNYKILEKSDTHLVFASRTSNETVSIEKENKYIDAYELMKTNLKDMQNKNVKNSTEKRSDVTVYEIKDTESGVNTYYFNKFNKTFTVQSKNYKDSSAENEAVSYMIDTLRLDFKVKST